MIRAPLLLSQSRRRHQENESPEHEEAVLEVTHQTITWRSLPKFRFEPRSCLVSGQLSDDSARAAKSGKQLSTAETFSS